MFDDVLPARLITRVVKEARALRRRLGRGAMRTTLRSFWFPDRRAPTNVFEEAITVLRAQVRPRGAVGAEYWFYFSDGEEVFRPHFDKDESRWDREHVMYWPLCTSVLYLSDTGAPTALFEVTARQLAADPDHWLASKNMAVWPAKNRALVMKGGTYHGVIAPPGMRASDKRARASFMAAWWTRKPAAPSCEDVAGDLVDALEQRLAADRKRRKRRR